MQKINEIIIKLNPPYIFNEHNLFVVGDMGKSKKSIEYEVVREFLNLYDYEELLL